jgi:hypothetical protein
VGVTEQVFALSGPAWHHPHEPETLVSEAAPRTLEPARPNAGQPLTRQVAMPRPGRPTKVEQARRRSLFLSAIANGCDVVQARRQAQLNPDDALRIVTESGFLEIVQALRAGTAVVEADDDRIAA